MSATAVLVLMFVFSTRSNAQQITDTLSKISLNEAVALSKKELSTIEAKQLEVSNKKT